MPLHFSFSRRVFFRDFLLYCKGFYSNHSSMIFFMDLLLFCKGFYFFLGGLVFPGMPASLGSCQGFIIFSLVALQGILSIFSGALKVLPISLVEISLQGFFGSQEFLFFFPVVFYYDAFLWVSRKP